MIISVENLSVTYCGRADSVEALSDVSFALTEGQTLGLVGESGSGKSTCALSILGLLPPGTQRKGEIIFNNQDLCRITQEDMQGIRGNEIALISQDPAGSFNPVLSIGYQFHELLSVKRSLRRVDERTTIMADTFSRVHLHEGERILRSYPHQLSGGQLQRVAIAMAISLQPKLLIADEPTSSLDVTIESQIVHLFNELKKDLGLSILFITHNLELVKALCEQVVVLYEGQVKETASCRDLFEAPHDSYTKQLLASFRAIDG